MLTLYHHNDLDEWLARPQLLGLFILQLYKLEELYIDIEYKKDVQIRLIKRKNL